MRFGDPRVMALTGALCQTLLAATGFTNTSLRAVIAGLLGSDYRSGQMTHDLRRLRLAGLIRRLPRSNRYTPDRRRHPHRGVLHQALQPAAAADRRRPAPGTADLHTALATITRHVDDYAARARPPPAA